MLVGLEVGRAFNHLERDAHVAGVDRVKSLKGLCRLNDLNIDWNVAIFLVSEIHSFCILIPQESNEN